MNKFDYNILTNLLRNYIEDRPLLNKSALAQLIDMKRHHFKEWLDQKRPLPKNRIEPLENELKKYGFMQKST